MSNLRFLKRIKMNKATLVSIKKVGLLVLVSIFCTQQMQAQTPTKCLEIESILVDACVPGTGCTTSTSPSCSCEGKNEMVRFKIGPTNINVPDLSIDWPNNSFLGISAPNATTASLVSALNSTILSCGYLIEPIGGVLPAGRTILIITSTEMCTTANSFANLSDTIYVIFQNAGNFQGHFVNYSSIPGLRTTIFTQISSACADTVTYDKSLLINQLGGYGGSSLINDGSTVEFSWPGVANYINLGCLAPFQTINAAAGTGGTICPSGTFSLTGTASGPYSSILWMGGTGIFSSPTSLSTNYTAGAADAGSVILTLAAIGNCNDTVFSTVIVNITPIPTSNISASGSTSICVGNSVTLTATGGTTYSWSTGSSASSISVSAAGTYTVTSSNVCGSQIDTMSVFVTPLPIVTIANGATANLCVGDTVILYATGIGNYVWTGGSTNDSIYATAGGTYSITSTNSCGSATDAITITSITTPSPVITAGGGTTICPGDSVSLTASGGGTYSWSTGSSATTIFVSAAGTYTLTATNICGAQTATQTVTVSAIPTVTLFSSGISFCTGSSIQLWAAGTGTFSWTGGSTNDSITVSTGGTYVVTVSTSCGSATDNITINELPLPVATISAVGTTFCIGDSIILTGAGGTSYLWQPSAASTSFISATTSGTYTLTASNSCGIDTATISVTTVNPPTANITSGSPTICLGDSLALNASGGGTYVWSTGETTNSITATIEGSYWVSTSNICGSDTALVNINVDSVMAFFTNDIYTGTYPLTVNFTNGSSSNASGFFWDFGDGTTASGTFPANTFQEPGTYVVTLSVTNSSGCTDTYSITIVVLENPSVLVVPNVFSPNNDGQNDLFFVTGTYIQDFQCAIYDRWGLKMVNLSSITDRWDGRTAAGVLATDGTYYYIIKATGLDKKDYGTKGFIQLVK